MPLSKEKNPKLFFSYLGAATILLISTFLHLIYFDFVILMGISFLALILLILVSQSILQPIRRI